MQQYNNNTIRKPPNLMQFNTYTPPVEDASTPRPKKFMPGKKSEISTSQNLAAMSESSMFSRPGAMHAASILHHIKDSPMKNNMKARFSQPQKPEAKPMFQLKPVQESSNKFARKFNKEIQVLEEDDTEESSDIFSMASSI